MTTAEEKEILSLLCKVHELEIDKVDMMMLVIMVVIMDGDRMPGSRVHQHVALLSFFRCLDDQRDGNLVAIDQCGHILASGGDEE